MHPRAGIVGFIGVLVAFIILSYSVIGGWILKYIFSYLTTFSAPQTSTPLRSAGDGLLAFPLYGGDSAHLFERGQRHQASKFMMPTLFVCLLAVIIRSVTLPGALEGLQFIFMPTAAQDGSGFGLSSVSAALGQVFYSLSLCMGITITYGSYLNKKENIPRSCLNVAAMDTSPGGAGRHCDFPGGVLLWRGCRPGPQPDLQHAAEGL